MSSKNKKERSAGFVIVTKSSGSFRILGLYLNGKIDIPKGHVEIGESNLEAAKRECLEEANIVVKDSDMKWGNECFVIRRTKKDVIVYIAETTQTPKIMMNPETGIYEHDEYAWLTWSDMKANCYPHLRRAIDWAQSKIDGI
jgi:8-oxo-dGTP pyrophosphatase MutT (NUDIX family)